MKKIIIILGTVVLGAWIVSHLIMGGVSGNSLQAQSNNLINKANTEITEMIKGMD